MARTSRPCFAAIPRSCSSTLPGSSMLTPSLYSDAGMASSDGNQPSRIGSPGLTRKGQAGCHTTVRAGGEHFATIAFHVAVQDREDHPRSGRLTPAMDNKALLEAWPLDPTDRARGSRPDSSPAQPFASCYWGFLQSRSAHGGASGWLAGNDFRSESRLPNRREI
jgi:hypothetical protein